MKKYIIEVSDNGDGTCEVKKEAWGFNAYELIGHLTMTIRDIEKQIAKEIKPEIISRKVHVEEIGDGENG